MASSENSAETPTQSQACDTTPALHQQILDSGITIALFEIGSLPSSCWGSLPSLKKDSQKVVEPETAQKFEYIVQELGNILNFVMGFGKKVTEAKETFEETISEDVSDFKEKIRRFGKTNKKLLKKLLINSVPEKEQEVVCENQTPENKVQVSVRDLANCSEEKRVLNETQLSEEEGKHGSPHAQEENIKLLNNMEQLLQEAEHWSKQHTELHGLIQSYQKSQKDRRKSKNNQVSFQMEPNNQVSIKNELEEQVRKLNQDTYSLHLVAALLDNECQILQKRVELLRRFHQYQEETPLGVELNQMNPEQDKKTCKTSEAEQVETDKENTQEMRDIVYKKIGVSKSLDVCLNKKARNNQLNNNIARGLMRRKRPASSLR